MELKTYKEINDFKFGTKMNYLGFFMTQELFQIQMTYLDNVV